MSELQKVNFDGVDYYLSSDVDEIITGLDGDIEDLEGEKDELQDDVNAAYHELTATDDYKTISDNLKALLRKSVSILGDFTKQDYEVNFNGRIMDISGFISDIEWDLKE